MSMLELRWPPLSLSCLVEKHETIVSLTAVQERPHKLDIANRLRFSGAGTQV